MGFERGSCLTAVGMSGGVGECARRRGTSGRVAPQEEPREGPRGLCHGLTVHPSAPAPRGEELQLPLSAPGRRAEPGTSGAGARVRATPARDLFYWFLVVAGTTRDSCQLAFSVMGVPDSPMTPIDRDEKQNETKNTKTARDRSSDGTTQLPVQVHSMSLWPIVRPAE